MPVRLEEEPESHLLVVHLEGKLTRFDYEQFVPVADHFIEAHRPARLLLDMTDFTGWELGAAWDDLKFGVKHFSDMTRLALVGDRRWKRWLATIFKPFTVATVRVFDESHAVEARQWVSAL